MESQSSELYFRMRGSKVNRNQQKNKIKALKFLKMLPSNKFRLINLSFLQRLIRNTILKIQN